MKCPSCSSENLPVRETSSTVGSVVSHPSNCGQCGHALTEKCPVCTYHHAIGTKFCQADGTSIQAWISEENVWQALLLSMRATLSIRPAKYALALILAAIPGLYVVGGIYLENVRRFYSDPMDLGGVFAGAVLVLLSMGFPMAVVAAIMESIEGGRRRKFFRTQGYKALKPVDRIL